MSKTGLTLNILKIIFVQILKPFNKEYSLLNNKTYIKLFKTKKSCQINYLKNK